MFLPLRVIYPSLESLPWAYSRLRGSFAGSGTSDFFPAREHNLLRHHLHSRAATRKPYHEELVPEYHQPSTCRKLGRREEASASPEEDLAWILLAALPTSSQPLIQSLHEPIPGFSSSLLTRYELSLISLSSRDYRLSLAHFLLVFLVSFLPACQP